MRDKHDGKEAPDYFAGRLIYYDDISPETMRWIVYDGHRKIRFTSRRAAERWCAAESLKVHSEVIDRLMVAYLYADKAKQALDAAASFANELRKEIEFYALEIRKISDKIDTIIAQSCTRTRNNQSEPNQSV